MEQAVPAELLARYDSVGPRYTSYPTAVDFHSGYGDAEMAQLGRNFAAQVAARKVRPTGVVALNDLIAIERNIDYQMSEELKQAGGNQALEKPAALTAELDAPAHVYDLRAAQYLGQTNRIAFTLEPWQPALFALLPEKVAAEKIIDNLLSEAPAASEKK